MREEIKLIEDKIHHLSESLDFVCKKILENKVFLEKTNLLEAYEKGCGDVKEVLKTLYGEILFENKIYLKRGEKVILCDDIYTLTYIPQNQWCLVKEGLVYIEPIKFSEHDLCDQFNFNGVTYRQFCCISAYNKNFKKIDS